MKEDEQARSNIHAGVQLGCDLSFDFSRRVYLAYFTLEFHHSYSVLMESAEIMIRIDVKEYIGRTRQYFEIIFLAPILCYPRVIDEGEGNECSKI